MKTYIKPRLKAMDVQLRSIIAGSFTLNNTNEYTGDGTNMSNSHRELWGNLWGNGDDEE